jgi:hypothetical protein
MSGESSAPVMVPVMQRPMVPETGHGGIIG